MRIETKLQDVSWFGPRKDIDGTTDRNTTLTVRRAFSVYSGEQSSSILSIILSN